MRKWVNWMCGMVLCVGLSSGVYAAQDQVVLVVNDDVITSSEMQQTKMHMEKSGAFASDGRSKQKQLIDYIINEHLQLQQAKFAGLTVSEKEVDEALKRIADSNRISVSMLLESLKQSGMSLKEYRHEMQKRLLFQKLMSAHVTKPPVVTEPEVTTFFKKYQASLQKRASQSSAVAEYHVYDYLLPFKQNNAEERTTLLKQAERLRDRLMQGKSLSGISHEVEDLGVRTSHEMPELFLKHVQSLKAGDYSRPFVAANGVHVLNVAGLLTPNTAPPSLTRDEAKQMVLEQKLQEMMREWLLELRAQSYVEIKVHEE